MKLKHIALSYILLLVLFPIPDCVLAQPMLPDLTGTSQNGIVLLTWKCQFEGVKSIVVRSSKDSTFNFRIIGFVRKTGQGVQAYADGHPQKGNNFYKLTIVFNSGLNWTSNLCKVYVSPEQISALKVPYPRNDSLQQYITTEVHDTVEEAAGAANKQAANTHKRNDVKFTAGTTEIAQVFEETAPEEGDVKKEETHIVIHRKVSLSFPELDLDDVSFVRSLYVKVNPQNGHVEVILPDEAKGHIYSISFYNTAKKIVLQIPLIKRQVIIIDKRNFQRSGIYKFVLKEHDTELESGRIKLDF